MNILVNRLCGYAPQEGDPGTLSIDDLFSMLGEWIRGDLSASQMKQLIPNGLSGESAGAIAGSQQGDELDAILATCPNSLAGLSGLLAGLAPLANQPKEDWRLRVRDVVILAQSHYDGYGEPTQLAEHLGVSY